MLGVVHLSDVELGGKLVHLDLLAREAGLACFAGQIEIGHVARESFVVIVGLPVVHEFFHRCATAWNFEVQHESAGTQQATTLC